MTQDSNIEPDYIKIVMALEILNKGIPELKLFSLKVSDEILGRVNKYQNDKLYTLSDLEDSDLFREVMYLDLKREADDFHRFVGDWPLPVILANSWVNQHNILIGRIPDFSVKFVQVYATL